IDLVGIASIDRFKDLPEWAHPSSILPECSSVIVVAQQIPRGYLRGIEEGTHWIEPNLDVDRRLIHLLGRFIEDHGWEAVPVPRLPLERWPEGIPVSPNKPAPNVTIPFDYAAVAAGLGEIGYCKVFLTPEFGPLQQLGVILTDAPLEPDPIFNGKICDVDRCLKCVDACPFNAISSERRKEVNVAGKIMIYGEINFNICRKCPNGAFPNRVYPEKGEPNRLAASCIRSCLVYLESSGKLKIKYNQPFRKREPWLIKW
ncbi:MAG: hypothetical protein QXU81_10500, partial [Candidatus Bathyarchaeia archaeon]